jgi:hypothetical protein
VNERTRVKCRPWWPLPHGELLPVPAGPEDVSGLRVLPCGGGRWAGSRWRAVASDDLPAGTPDLARPVRVDDKRPAHLVEHHVMVPPTVKLQVRQAGVPAVLAVHHVVRLAAGGGLGAAAGELAPLVPQGHEAAQVHGDVVGLALVCILYLCQEAWTQRMRKARDHSSGQRVTLRACLTCLSHRLCSRMTCRHARETVRRDNRRDDH